MIYLLSIEEFLKENREKLFEEALLRVDEERRRKAFLLRQPSSRAACLGAGLLLQLAAGEAQEAKERQSVGADCPEREGQKELKIYSVSGILHRLEGKEPIPFAYRYGQRGKPYFQDFPFYFSLSHSGEYVLCALSEREIGADIQQRRGSFTARIAERFFTRQELAALKREGAEGEKYFFRLWARKEAFGKLDGGGIGSSLGVSLHPGIEYLPDGRKLFWEEHDELPGYSIAVCQYELS